MRRLTLTAGCLLLIAQPVFAGVGFPSGGSVGTSSNGQLLYNNSSSVAGMTTYAASGDISISATGVTTVTGVQGTAVSAPTGTGSVVLSNAPQISTGLGIGTAAVANPQFTIYGASGAGAVSLGNIASDTNHNTLFLNGYTSAGNYNLKSGASDLNFRLNRPSGYKITMGENDVVEDTFAPTNGALTLGTSSIGSTLNVLNAYGSAAIGTSMYGTQAPANGLLVQGSVGIGTATANATLDVYGYTKLKTNAAAPATCGATYEGAIAYTGTTTHYLCFCNGTSWVKTTDNTTACTW